MNAVTEHEGSKDHRRDHLEVRNVANLKKHPHLFVSAEKDYSSDHQEKEAGHFQKEFVEGPQKLFESRLQRFDHGHSWNSPFPVGIITQPNLNRPESFLSPVRLPGCLPFLTPQNNERNIPEKFGTLSCKLKFPKSDT
jgi:hypothetical protein